MALQRCALVFRFLDFSLWSSYAFVLFYWLSMVLKSFVYPDDAFGSHLRGLQPPGSFY